MKRIIVFYILFSILAQISVIGQVSVSGSNTADGTYSTLTVAGGAFSAINTFDQSGRTILIAISGSTAETGAVALTGALGVWTKLTIYPTGSSYSLSGSATKPLIDLSGADNVIIDGRVNRSGSSIDLSIINTNTTAGASTIRFVNSADYDTIKYCTIKGSASSATKGVIFFSLNGSGLGNNNNVIINNNITNNSGIRPINAIFSSGDVTYQNSNNKILNNCFYDFLNSGISSNGVNISSNSTIWDISGNSFYETTSFVPTADVEYSAIRINALTASNMIISNNFFGGSAALCSGTWNKSNNFNNIFSAIYFNGNSVSIQGNTISNINWSNSSSADWTGINLEAGTANVGTSSGNLIGASTGIGSITVTDGGSNSYVYGIKIGSTQTVDCQNNTLRSITTANSSSANATNFIGIKKGATSGSTTISNNVIGHPSESNSIYASSNSTSDAQNITGIISGGTNVITINSNTIANLTNGTNNTTAGIAGFINGIKTSSRGQISISENIIHNLTIANANTATDSASSVSGIVVMGNSQNTISKNTIYNLTNTYASFVGSVKGIYYYSGIAYSNSVKGNFIHSLSLNIISSGAYLYGIHAVGGITTYSNNIITIGGNTSSTIYGIWETGSSTDENNLFFNTIYIYGTPSSASLNSYPLFDNSDLNWRDIQNNILYNARVNSGGATGKHYAIRLAGVGLNIDANDYFVTDIGSGNFLGYIAGDIITFLNWQSSTANDAISLNLNPTFTTPGSTVASDYQLGTTLNGLVGTLIIIDYNLNSRGTTPSMGAWEMTINKWKGNLNNQWSTATNWTAGAVPSPDANIIFDASAVNHCNMNSSDRTVNNISNSTAYRIVTNGNKLTIKGSISGSGQIDASATSSTIEFAGALAQSIPLNTFYNNQVYNLTINNLNNVSLFGTLNLLNTLTCTSGLLDATTNSPTISYVGSSTQTLNPSNFVSNKVYNLTFNNSSGVSLNNDFTIENTLAASSGRLILSASKTLTLKGTLSVTGGNIDASGFSSNITFAGIAAQSIPSGTFYNNNVYNLTINNSNNVALSGSLSLLNTITITSGRLDATTNSPTIIFGGSSPQTIETSRFLNDAIYNLTFSNSTGVSLNTNFSVENTLTGTSGNLTIASTKQLTLKGAISLSGGAQIDASTNTNTLIFNGSSAQSIPSGAFINNKVYNLTINKAANNVAFNGTLVLLNTLTATSGRLDATTNSPTLNYGGSSAQTIENNQLLSGTAYNLVIDNTSGVTQNTDLTINNAFTINTGKVFNLAAGKYLTVSASTTNDGTLNLKSSAGGTASFIANGTLGGAGTTNSERYITGNTWHNASSPVSGQTIANFISTNTIPTSPTTPTNYGMEFYTEDKTVTEGGWSYFTTTYTPGNVELGSGYMVRKNSSVPVTFTGSLNNAQVNKTVTRNINGWNSVGNPFSSSIAINDNAAGTNFLRYNTVTNLNIDASYGYIYLWNGSSYSIINNSSPSMFVQPGQGFIIKKAANANTYVSFTTAMQAHSSHVFYKKSTSDWDEITLNISSSKDTANTKILFRDDMTRGLDVLYDAGQFGGNPDFLIYTKLVADNGVNFMVQCLPSQETDSLTIPIGLDCKNGGLVVFNAIIGSLPVGYGAILEDRLLGLFTDLTATDAKYEVLLQAGISGTGRFFLHTNEGSTFVNLNNADNLITYAVKKEIYIKGNVSAGSVASVYDLLGKKMIEYKLGANNLNIIEMNSFQDGIYIVKIADKGKLKANKVFIGN
jgi:hypothetical protein